MNRERKEITVLTLFSLVAIIDTLDLVHGIWVNGKRYLIFQNAYASLSPVTDLINLILYFVGIFMMRSLLERHYREAEPIGLSLSGVMTFFFGALYFQYHLHDIAEFRGRQVSRLSI